jgi:hypothetical protein
MAIQSFQQRMTVEEFYKYWAKPFYRGTVRKCNILRKDVEWFIGVTTLK